MHDPSRRPADIAIVGGGASGVMLAAQLVRQSDDARDIILIDRGPAIGRGIAYATECPEHVLNVRADNMSAFADDADHFVRWLDACGNPGCHNDFMPRMHYGDYLESVLAEAVSRSRGKLRLVRGDVVAASEAPASVRLFVAPAGENGAEGPAPIDAKLMVLATGHCPPSADRGAYRGNPWDRAALEDLAPDASVLIVGTSLTMVDVVISLLERGHTGPIIAVSRRGLLPRIHPAAQAKHPDVDVKSLLAGPLSARLGRLRKMVAAGTPWHDVMQKLRGVTQDLWRGLDADQRRRFLRHLRPWWDVHRHRLAPAIGTALTGALASGQLTIMAGRVRALDCAPAGVTVTLVQRGSEEKLRRSFDRVVDCSGPRSGVEGRSPLHLQLLSAGLVCDDPMQLGLEVDTHDCAQAPDGNSDTRIFALGPPTRAAHWEISAVPDIRQRAALLAGHLLDVLEAERTAEVKAAAS